ncbi:MAG: DivIVA domain-containing protein [Vicinamibacterales bacterium]
MFKPDDAPQPRGTMTVTPLDLRQAKFATAMRGFDKNEVSAFLLETADGYEQALRENERLRQELARAEGALAQSRELEGSLKNTLVSAQKVADDMRENAQREAALILETAQVRVEDIQREIEGLRLRRREVEAGIEAMISTLHHTLDFVREQDAREREERVVPHRPRLESARLA